MAGTEANVPGRGLPGTHQQAGGQLLRVLARGRFSSLVHSVGPRWDGPERPGYQINCGVFRFSDGCAPKGHLFDERALQEYILICCQHPQGGLIDKPGKPRDSYHSCYAISGLSVAQHFLNDKNILGTYRNELVRGFLN